MVIEFQCAGCSKRLRVKDEFAGRQAKCPGCGAISQVPDHAPEAPVDFGDEYELVPPDLEASPPPIASPQSGNQQTAFAASENPYVAPSTDWQVGGRNLQHLETAPLDHARRQVLAPAIGLIVASMLGMLMYGLAFMGFLLDVGGRPRRFGPNQPEVAVQNISVAFLVLAGGAMCLLVLFGAIKMMKLETYGLAVTASIIGMLPCIYCGCFVGLPFGIWSLVVLNDAAVKSAFRS